MADLLPCVEVDTGGPVRGAVIWLHGLGADGHDFEPIVERLGLSGLGVRFVFPHAPRRAVTMNGGLLMPAWFDIRDPSFGGDPDFRGLHESVAQVEALVGREIGRGVPAGRIVLAGFSQGGTVALHAGPRLPDLPAGLVALSTFMAPDEKEPPPDAARENAGSRPGRLPVFLAHGTDDPMVPLELGEQTRDRLQALGHAVTFRTYPMAHEVCAEEIADIGAFLKERFLPGADGAGR